MNIPTHVALDAHAALEKAQKLIGEYLKEAGGCDHSVGVCVCADRKDLREIKAAREALQPYLL